MMLLCSILLISALVGDTLEDDITPTSPEEYYLEGSRVKISCNYTVEANNLQWYRQYPGSAPQFLLLLTDTATPLVVEATPPYPRMTAKLNDERTRVDLEISGVVTDSALYYCALQPTVTGNPETLYKNLTAHEKLLLFIF
uniref:Ig-like domain-containing protein n=1 Tax=Hucho hucho TaxID=62062 RepID=A0A4W5L771_9TELE